MDAHNLEPQELNDRIRMYSHKLSQQWGNLQEDPTCVTNGECVNVWMIPALIYKDYFTFLGLLKDIPSSEAERLLSAIPILDADLHLVIRYLFFCIFQVKFLILFLLHNFVYAPLQISFPLKNLNFFFFLEFYFSDSKFYTKIIRCVEWHQS